MGSSEPVGGGEMERAGLLLSLSTNFSIEVDKGLDTVAEGAVFLDEDPADEEGLGSST